MIWNKFQPGWGWGWRHIEFLVYNILFPFSFPFIYYFSNMIQTMDGF